MKIIVFGNQGMLGRYVESYLKSIPQYSVTGISRDQLDVRNATLDSVTSFCDSLIPKEQEENDQMQIVFINCIGLTNKINAGAGEFQAVNCDWVYLLGTYAASQEIPVIHASTDCVFSSGANSIASALNNNEESPCTATDLYGRSKAAGDYTHPWVSVLRVSIIGQDPRHKRGFIEFVKDRVERNLPVPGFVNHVWNGITCLEWAKVMHHIIQENLYWHGIRHLVPRYVMTKFDLASQVVSHLPVSVSMLNRNALVTPVWDTSSVIRILGTTDYTFSKQFDIPDLSVQLQDLFHFSLS